MDFEEFLWATGHETMMSVSQNAYLKRESVDSGFHRLVMDVFRQYLVVGGMPRVVRKSVKTHDLVRVDVEKRDILELYRVAICS